MCHHSIALISRLLSSSVCFQHLIYRIILALLRTKVFFCFLQRFSPDTISLIELELRLNLQTELFSPAAEYLV